MRYFFARLVITITRLACWILLLPSLLLFLWCLYLVVPPIYENGLSWETIRNGRGGIEQAKRRALAKEPWIGDALSMGTSEVSTGIIAGGAALAALLASVLLLAACDMMSAILDTATNTAQLLAQLKGNPP